jgi:hypothetical protein
VQIPASALTLIKGTKMSDDKIYRPCKDESKRKIGECHCIGPDKCKDKTCPLVKQAKGELK